MAKVWFMEVLEQHDPEFAQLVAGNREVVMKDGAIPARYKVLMTLLVDAILGHAEGVHSIAQRARAAGASEQEICETVRGQEHVKRAPEVAAAGGQCLYIMVKKP
jgi:alkylhydroperoxidase/carboxymuconolactone decarboxylase family protein YurZ